MTKPNQGKESPSQSNKPETREQRRYRERINIEAQEVIQKLQNKFSDFFTTCEDPEGQEVVDKIAEISAQWRTHCKRRGLVPAAYPVLDQYMDAQLRQYQELKNNPEKVIRETVEN